MPLRPSVWKILAGLAAASVVGMLAAWLALPGLLKSQAEKFVAEKTGHRLILERPAFNLFDLRLRFANLRLDEPDGKPLLAFRELVIDLSAASIVRRALVFDAIRLDAPQVVVVLRRDGRLNWSALLDALKGKEEKKASALPRLDVGSFVLAGGQGEFRDEKAGFETRIETLDLELGDMSTLTDERGRYKLSARTGFGARIDWHGEATLAPLAVTGSFAVENLDVARLAPYFKDLPVAVPAGIAGVSADYRLAYAGGRVDAGLDNIAASLSGLKLTAGMGPAAAVSVERIEAANGRFDLKSNRLAFGTAALSNGAVELPQHGGALKPLRLARLTLDDVDVDLAGRMLGLGRVALAGGQLRAARDAQGRIDVVAAAQAIRFPVAAAKPAANAAPAWRYAIGQLEATDFAALLRDDTVAPAAELALEDIAVTVGGLGGDSAKPLAVRAVLRARTGGTLEVVGEVAPAAPAADLRLKLAGLDLRPAQPYLAPLARLDIAAGRLDVDGRLAYGKAGPAFRGRFAVNGLSLREAGGGDLFLAWKSLAGKQLEAARTRLDIGELAIDGLDTRFTIYKDKSTNLAAILKKTAAPPPAEAPAATAPPPAAAPAFLVNVERLRIGNSAMDFADLSLALPFSTRIHGLHGTVAGLSSRPGAPAQIELDGEVDDYGLARAVGQIDFFKPTAFTDVKVVFRNVEMTRLTPYAATFAGRRIASGKLSLDLEYKIDKRRLSGENQVIMDRLTLGERVEGVAANLPLDLAIAVLQDADGRIDLGLPVSGSLDDPQFSYGGIIWKAILNVIGKIATAPFRALGALFGGGEKFENLAFEAGEAKLTPPEREKLVRLAGALAKRPGLTLTVHGAYAEADRIALQDRQLRRAVAGRAGQRAEGAEEPGPLSTRTPKIQAALESLFADRFGSGELDSLRQAFRLANPGQLEEGVAGKLASRLSGLLRERRTPSEQEVAELKGADFHAVLYERLRRRETVADDPLRALAAARGEQVMTALKAAGAPAERLSLGAPEKADGGGRDVPVKLVLGAR